MTKKSNVPHMPFVSVCTPTYNRRPFIPFLFDCFRNQKYPKHRLEWIIVDDGTDKIKDLVDQSKIPQIKYFPVEKKMTLGAKRNYMHEHCKGSIILYMDDDDYYPPERIPHAVEMLQKNHHALCAGSSEVYLYFKGIQKMYQFGPYGPNHATAATFAFRRDLLNVSRYDDNACVAEEKKFLKDYTIPFVQLDPLKTILVFSHEHNSYDKRELLQTPNSTMRESNKKIDMFIKNKHEENIYNFFVRDIDELLKNYHPGHPNMKPDVAQQLKDLKEQREKEAQQQQQQSQILMQSPGKEPVPLTMMNAVNIINRQQQLITKYETHIQELETQLLELEETINHLKHTTPKTEAPETKKYSPTPTPAPTPSLNKSKLDPEVPMPSKSTPAPTPAPKPTPVSTPTPTNKSKLNPDVPMPSKSTPAPTPTPTNKSKLAPEISMPMGMSSKPAPPPTNQSKSKSKFEPEVKVKIY